MQEFSIQGNEQLHFIPDNYSQGWNSLSILTMADTGLYSLPLLSDVQDTLTKLDLSNTNIDNLSVEGMAVLRNLDTLSIKNIRSKRLPSTCPHDVSAMVINAATSELELCRCHGLWLKKAQEAGAKVKVDSDVRCGDSLWTSLSSADLIEICADIIPGK
jgi:Leucine-rich repeat (LRR) protein